MRESNLVALNEWLLRRSYSTPEKKYMNPDGSATSRVFKLREKDANELSVNVESKTTHEKTIGDKTKYILFRIANQYVNSIGLKTYHAPEEDGSNNAHAVILGMLLEDDIKPGLLAKASKKVVMI